MLHASSNVDMTDWINKITLQFKMNFADLGDNVEKLISTVNKKIVETEKERPWSADPNPDVKGVLNFWLNFVTSDDNLSSNSSFWFFRSDIVDSFIQKEWSATIKKAINGECDDWMKTPCGCVALIILLDQFNRNIYRNSKEMFLADPKAIKVAQIAMESTDCNALPNYMKLWIQFPYSRSEDLETHKKSTAYLQSLYDQSKINFFQIGVKNGKQQEDILSIYGRFPARNKMLGRSSTSKEKEYLKSNKLKSFSS